MGVPRVSIRDCFDIAAGIVGLDGWQGYQWSVAKGGFIVKGCVPSGFYKKGPRKGQPKFRPAMPNTDFSVAVSDDKCFAFIRDYEDSTGNCFVCKGTGQSWCGWSAETGARYRDCGDCGATGKATPPTRSRPHERED